MSKDQMTPRKIIVVDDVPAVAAARGEVERVEGVMRELREELEVCDFQAAEQANTSEVEDAIFRGGRVSATAIAAAPPCRPRHVIANELAAAERALERKNDAAHRERQSAIAAELAHPSHQAKLASIGKTLADAALSAHEASVTARKLAVELERAGYRPAGAICSPIVMAGSSDFSLTAPQSLARATMLRLLGAGLVDAEHPAAKLLRNRD